MLRIIVNEASGLGAGPDLSTFEARGADLVPIDRLDGLSDDTTIIGACGGDGTIACAASEAVERGIPLLVVPGGTLNHFAGDLGIGSEDEALAALDRASPEAVDVGCIDDRIFLNNASLGAYPELVDTRERFEPRLGKRVAGVLAVFLVLRRGTPSVLEVDGRRRRVWLAWFGNCRYDLPGLFGAGRPALDDGLLDVRIVHADRKFARLRLLGAAVLRRLDHCSVLESRVAEQVAIRSLDERIPRLAADGETFDGHPQFVVAKRPGALTVLR